MQMSPASRKYMLILHLVCSIGWLGAVAAFLTLAAMALKSNDSQQVASFYIAMRPIGWYIIVPLSVGALVSGVIQSLGTPLGLFRYYWVVVKLLLTAIGTGLLLLHMKYIRQLATTDVANSILKGEFRALRIRVFSEAGGALLLLVFLTAISVIKPWGKIRAIPSNITWKYLLVGLILLASVFAIYHMTSGDMHMHGPIHQ